MKVLLHHLTPFALDEQTWKPQILKTRAALEASGVEVDFLRWYDGKQTGEILHFFGRMPSFLIPFAHSKRMKVVVTDLFPADAPPLKRPALLALEKLLPSQVTSFLDWDSYRLADVCVVASENEKQRLGHVFRVPSEKIRVVPEGDEARLKEIYEGLLKSS